MVKVDSYAAFTSQLSPTPLSVADKTVEAGTTHAWLCWKKDCEFLVKLKELDGGRGTHGCWSVGTKGAVLPGTAPVHEPPSIVG